MCRKKCGTPRFVSRLLTAAPIFGVISYPAVDVYIYERAQTSFGEGRASLFSQCGSSSFGIFERYLTELGIIGLYAVHNDGQLRAMATMALQRPLRHIN